MKKYHIAFLAAALASSLSAAPVDDVTAAAKKLADAPNYSWTATTENAGGGGFGAGTTTGVTEKGGYTVITREFNGTPMQTVRKGDKIVLQNREGEWVTMEELMQQFGGGGGGGGRPRGGMFGAETPAEQMSNLATLTGALKEADGTIAGDLTEKGATTLMTFGRSAPKNASGTLTVWLKDGALTKYQLHLKGTVTTRDGSDRQIDRTTTIEVKDVGTSKVQPPEPALKKLGS